MMKKSRDKEPIFKTRMKSSYGREKDSITTLEKIAGDMDNSEGPSDLGLSLHLARNANKLSNCKTSNSVSEPLIFSNKKGEILFKSKIQNNMIIFELNDNLNLEKTKLQESLNQLLIKKITKNKAI